MTFLRPYTQRDVVLTGAKATPFGCPAASLDPGSGRRPNAQSAGAGTTDALLRLSAPVRPIPTVIGVDDFALRKRQRYATDVVADRTEATLESWLRDQPGVQVVCRDGSGAYAEAIRRALPDAVQVADRWHLEHNLAEAVLKEVAAHSACWGKTGPVPREGKRGRHDRRTLATGSLICLIVASGCLRSPAG